MTNEDAVKWLENLKQDIGKPQYSELWHYEQALSEIEELLKEQQPRVLKLTEFKESMPVWFEEKDGDIYCVLIANYYGFDVRVLNNNKKYRRYFIDWLCDYYCIDWRCWSAKPTEEQRKAEPWNGGEQDG